MIKILNDIGDNVIGFELSGKVVGEDYEKVLIPALRSKLKEGSRLKVLYQVGKDFDSYDFSAMIDDAKAGFMFYSAWEKIAVVSDISWIIDAVKAFSFTIPGDIKTFSNEDIEKAKVWLLEKDILHPNLKILFDIKTKTVILEPLKALSKDDFIEAKELIDPLIEENGKLNGFIIYTKDFPGWKSFGAFISHMEFIKEHHRHIKKLAFVTDSFVGDLGEKVGSHFVSAQVKNFDYNQLKAAKEWIDS
ncbi:MAG: STAS/SEC14 domain-containing protein [Sulfurospirillum sp.]